MTDCPNSLRINCVSSCSEWLHWRMKLTQRRERHTVSFTYGDNSARVQSLLEGIHSEAFIRCVFGWLKASLKQWINLCTVDLNLPVTLLRVQCALI